MASFPAISPLRRTPAHAALAVLELDPRALRGIDQALRLALGALRAPLSLFVLHSPDRGAQLLRVAESGAWQPVAENGSGRALGDQVIAAAAAAETSDAVIRGRVSVGHLGVVEYAALPVIVEGARTGVFAVVDRRQREWGPEQEAILRDIVGVVAGEVEWHRGRVFGADAAEAERLAAAVIEATSDGVVLFDAERRCRLWNRSMERRTGRSAEEAVGSSAASLEVLVGLGDLDGWIARALAREVAGEAELPVRARDGSTVRLVSLRSASGDITGAMVVLAAAS